MAEVDGKVILRSPEGKLYQVAPEDSERQQRDLGWTVADDATVQARTAEREQMAQYGGAGQQAQAALETVARTATFGAVPGFGSPEDITGRSALLREESPVTSFLAQAAGTVVPALAGGAVGSAAAGALGLGARGASVASLIAEGGLSGTADEVEEARAKGRAVNAGNILVNGIGGEIIGRAVPAVLRKGVSAVRNRVGGEVVEAAGEAVGEGVLASAERKALESAADVADGVPLGPDRDVFLVNAEKHITDTGSQRMAQALDTLDADVDDITRGAGVKQAKIKTLVDKTHPAQREWAAETSQAALDLRAQVRPKPGRAVPEGELPLPDHPPDLPVGGAAPSDLPSPESVAPTDFGKVAGLGKFAKDLDEMLAAGSRELDEAADGADWFMTADRLKRSVSEVEKKIRRYAASPGAVDPAAADDLLSLVQGYRQKLRTDLERVDLWGQAGEYQRGMNAAMHEHWIPGSDVVEADLARRMGTDFDTGRVSYRYDPSKARSFFTADETGRGLTPEFLKKKLEGAEQAIATQKKYGTASEAQISRMQKSVESIREQIKLSDDVRGAKARYAEREGVARESAKFDKEQAGSLREQTRAEERAARETERASAAAEAAQNAKNELIGNAVGAVVGAVAGSFGLGAAAAAAAKALRMTRLLGTLGRTGEASIATAARGAVRGSPARALRAAENALGKAGKIGVPVASTAISRFQGDHPTVQSAFEAKKRTLEAIARDPLPLHRAIGQSLGGLDRARPDLHGEISARLQVMAQYLHENLPSQLSASMTRPNGVPLSRATARDFALKYNSVTDPSSVLADVRDGMASPTQLRALEAVHPDIYQSLRLELARQVSEEPQMTTQRKLRLDILFGGDGTAGRAYGWPLAMAIKARRAERAQGARGASLSGNTNLAKNAPVDRATSAIANSVTNA